MREHRWQPPFFFSPTTIGRPSEHFEAGDLRISPYIKLATIFSSDSRHPSFYLPVSSFSWSHFLMLREHSRCCFFATRQSSLPSSSPASKPRALWSSAKIFMGSVDRGANAAFLSFHDFFEFPFQPRLQKFLYLNASPGFYPENLQSSSPSRSHRTQCFRRQRRRLFCIVVLSECRSLARACFQRNFNKGSACRNSNETSWIFSSYNIMIRCSVFCSYSDCRPPSNQRTHARIVSVCNELFTQFSFFLVGVISFPSRDYIHSM